MVVTFSRHPLSAVSPAAAPRCIMTPAQRLRRLASLRINRVIAVPFTRAFARQSAGAFVNSILRDRLHVRELLVGRGFRFGRGRKGTPAFLRRAGAVHGFSTKFVPPVADGRLPVSSTRIRKLIRAGRIRRAARLLGRPYALEGRRVSGRRIGRRLGFPTINVLPANQLLPPFGAYAVKVPSIGASGVANLGIKPTVARRPGKPLLEIHLFRTPPARLTETLEVELSAFLRPERKFPSLGALARQIGRDVKTAKRVLGRAGPGSG